MNQEGYDKYVKNMNVVTNLFVLGSIGIITSSFFNDDTISTFLFLFGGILLYISGALEFFLYDKHNSIKMGFIFVGIFSYSVAAVLKFKELLP